MIEIVKIEYEGDPECGCTNGHLQDVRLFFTNNGEVSVTTLRTCACMHGCNGADCVPEEGMTFESEEALDYYITNGEESDD